MDDELEDWIFYQTYLSHMKIISKFAMGFPLNLPFVTQVCRICRLYFFKPEVLAFGVILACFLYYVYTLDAWSRQLVGKVYLTWSTFIPSKVQRLGSLANIDSDDNANNSALKTEIVSAFAFKGRRQNMEDRFVVYENINGSGVSLYAVFDGHGGEFAANYARDHLMKSLNKRVVEVKTLLKNGKVFEKPIAKVEKSASFSEKKPEPKELDRKGSMKQSVMESPSKGGGKITDPLLLDKLAALNKKKPISREVKPGGKPFIAPAPKDISSYIEPSNSSINYGKLLTDEVLLADALLIEDAKKTMDVAGTTALIAVIEGSRLIVANVGDSRGVMCDGKGNAIPLSFDHKPQQMREQKRIEKAGGFIAFNGVWRVAGILATSRALGDYPLKDQKLVIADPDILTFELSDHKPEFLLLATDGLWDTFSNEEAVSFIKDHLSSEDFGAKSITLQAYRKGSLDNITVVIINLSKHNWSS